LAEPIRLALAQPWDVFSGFVDKVLVIGELEVRKLHHDFTDLLTRAVQPALWLLLFGEVFTRTHAIPTGTCPALTS